MADWDALQRELDLWVDAGKTATFWWRDDDAGPDDGRLAGLLEQRRGLGVPLALAVVPAWLEESSAALLRADPGAGVLQHGWAHANRAGPERRKCELTAARSGDDLENCLSRGQSLLAYALGSRFHAVMVPPWNRIDATVAQSLAARGFVGLSTLGPRPAPVRDGLKLANVHIDIVGWKGGGGFAGEATVLAAACDHLARRRTGKADADEPTGLMTHHRVHDRACDAFVERFVTVVRDHPAGLWQDAATIFPAAP
mgnify:CR=1 FL=1|jgi:hypothetical protein